MKICFGMIVFEGDYVLAECLRQAYPFANQILISQGPVKFWQQEGRTTSLDKTNYIIKNFPDPDNKIKIIHGLWNEKDDQANAYCKYISPDTDYLWNLDSDEVYKTSDLIKIIDYLRSENPSSVGIRSCSFFGGFNHYLTGFELQKDNFLRIFKYTNGATWLTHRPPTLKHVNPLIQQANHVDSDRLYADIGAQMYHYSYVFPSQVYKKVNYYKNIVSKDRCIDNYFQKVYLNWVLGTQTQKKKVEQIFKGVHEFKPEYRGECFPLKFSEGHPEAINLNMKNLTERFNNELLFYR